MVPKLRINLPHEMSLRLVFTASTTIWQSDNIFPERCSTFPLSGVIRVWVFLVFYLICFANACTSRDTTIRHYVAMVLLKILLGTRLVYSQHKHPHWVASSRTPYLMGFAFYLVHHNQIPSNRFCMQSNPQWFHPGGIIFHIGYSQHTVSNSLTVT